MRALIEWDAKQQRLARADGWDIFLNDSGEFRLMALDDTEAYPAAKRFVGGDGDVWLHVVHKAREGRELYKHALTFLRQRARREWRRISKFTANVTSR